MRAATAVPSSATARAALRREGDLHARGVALVRAGVLLRTEPIEFDEVLSGERDARAAPGRLRSLGRDGLGVGQGLA